LVEKVKNTNELTSLKKKSDFIRTYYLFKRLKNNIQFLIKKYIFFYAIFKLHFLAFASIIKK